MSIDAGIEFEWADGEYKFRLPYGQIRELEEKTGLGAGHILECLADGTWKLDHIYQTLRLGLIGGGMEPLAAKKLVERYVAERPLRENVIPAIKVLHALLDMPKDDPLPKQDAAETKTETATAPVEPASAASTESVRQSGSRRKKSISSRRGSSLQR